MRQDEGEISQRSRRASIRQVAAAAGVSTSAVSNVLDNPDVVVTSTRRRVEDAMSEVGYVRNGAARQLRGAPSTIAGCLLLDTANPFLRRGLPGHRGPAHRGGLPVIVGSTDVRAAQENNYLRMMEELGVSHRPKYLMFESHDLFRFSCCSATAEDGANQCRERAQSTECGFSLGEPHAVDRFNRAGVALCERAQHTSRIAIGN